MKKQTGISLLVFVFLLLCTMVLHPAGGSAEHLIKIANTIIITHAIALFSLPFGWVGFWGLTRAIGTERVENILAFGMISLGLVAVMIAAATNGIILPLFLQNYADAPAEKLTSIKPILKYGFAINRAFDYIYTFAFALAILCWSWAIGKTKKLPVWIGWLGIGVAITAIVLFIAGVALHTLNGFRVFTTVIIAWIALLGFCLMKDKSSG